MKVKGLYVAAVCLSLTGIGLTTGCASSSESASQDTLTENVGKYPPAPEGVNKPRVGVPPFKVQATGSFGSGSDLDDLAADQMTTLLDQSDRFKVIERTQLQKLLNEQNLEGIVKSDELARPAQIRGVDYLLLGKVTNLSVKTEKKERGFGLAQIGNIVGGADVKNKDVIITTSCGVDIRLVNPTTGELMTSSFSEYKKEDKAGAIGVDILGANASSDADIQMSEDDKGKILRLALDNALRKALPKIDKFLKNQPAQPSAAAPAQAPATPAAQNSAVAPTAVAAKRFCSKCGAEIPAGATFCPKCGAKVE
jgi:curli biogenesis system outer membrane secretion channel CsgG